MARITSYSLDQTLTSGDKVVGTDATTGTVRNYTVGELSTFINTASLGNYSFDTTQTPGAGTDNFVLTYDNSTGKISLEVAASQAAFNIIEDLTPQLGGTLDANSQIIDMGANTITDTKVGQWDTAYGWGDHSSASYLTSETSHTDVLVDGDFGTAGLMTTNGSGTYSITTNNSSNWDTAYGWGDHSAQGYITSETSHADVVVDGDFTSQGIMLRGASSGTYSILTDNSTNWNTAYGWGDHSTQGYVTTSGVTSVTGTAPVVSSGGTTPDISMAAATTSVNGYLTSTDWTTFNNKLTSVSGDPVPTLSGDLDVNNNGIVSSGGNISITPDASGNVVLDGISYPKVDGTIDQVLKTNGAGQLSFTTVGGGVTSVTGTTPVVSSGGTTPAISMAAATTSVDGYLSSTNWNTFNNKLSSVGGDAAPILGGDLDVNGNSIVSSGGGDISITPSGPGNVITSNVTIDGIKYPQTDGTGGQVLQTNGAGELSFATVSGGGGSGDVVGPSSATDNAIARFDTTTGKLLQNSSATIDDAGAITAPDFIGDLNGAVRFDAKAIGSAIDKGEVVYISGISGNTPEIQLAQSNSSATMPAFGIALADIAENNTGEVATFGSVKGLDVTDFGETSIIFSVGDTVYVSSTEAGKLTNVPPSGEANLIQNIGKIERATPTSNMTIKVGGAGRTNATPNLDSAKMFLGNSSNQSVSVAMSGDVTISNTGATTVGTINSVAVATVTAGAALGATAQQPPSEGAFVNGDKTKLDGIEALADVTDATNVTAAGALMDSEVTNLADVKAFATTDYATAAQGLTADAALPKAGGAMTGAITGNQDITGKRPIVTDTTTNIDLTLGTHEGTFIYSDNVAAVAVNIPPNSTQAFPVGTEIDMIQAGGGQVTVAPGTGVNLNGGIATIAITAQWGGATLKQITVDNWIIVGKI